MADSQATLCYIIKENRVLLIHKLRGVGAGKINGPGGKVDPGETPLAAAIRETQEETGVTPLNLRLRGELRFHFGLDEVVHCLIYQADDYVGQPQTTAEAVPEWYELDSLPYDEMWEDDRHWLPLLIGGSRFEGDVVVQGGSAGDPQFSSIYNE